MNNRMKNVNDDTYMLEHLAISSGEMTARKLFLRFVRSFLPTSFLPTAPQWPRRP